MLSYLLAGLGFSLIYYFIAIFVFLAKLYKNTTIGVFIAEGFEFTNIPTGQTGQL